MRAGGRHRLFHPVELGEVLANLPGRTGMFEALDDAEMDWASY